MTKCTDAPAIAEWFRRLYSVIVGTKKWSPGDKKNRLYHTHTNDTQT